MESSTVGSLGGELNLEEVLNELKEGDVSQVEVLIDFLRKESVERLTQELKSKLRGRLVGQSRRDQRELVRQSANSAFKSAAADALLLVARGRVDTLGELSETMESLLPYAVLREVVLKGGV